MSHWSVLLCILVGIIAESFNVPSSELQALNDLYDATDGPHWRWNPIQNGSEWNFSGSPNPCTDSWQGVVCSTNISPDGYVYVEMITLPFHNLMGPLPSSISNLTELISLDLSANELHGTIPQSIGNMSHLQFFNVSENKWTGNIPDTIGNLRELKVFDVSGVILDYYVIKSLIQTDPDHQSTGLNGSIPSSFANLTELKFFSVGYNELTGSLEPLRHLLKLEYLFLYLNQFTGAFPNCFQDMRNLTQVSIGGNSFTGEAWYVLENNVHLNRFIIGFNFFHGTIPAVLGERVHLVNLDLSFNFFHGPLPADVNNLTKLELFNVANNSLTGTIPDYLGVMLNMLYLDFAANDFNGTIPNCIGYLTNMTFLDLSDNGLSGTIPANLGNISNILHFNLGSNRLHGAIPKSLGNFNRAYLFDLNHNLLQGDIPESLSQLSSLQFLNLSDNRLIGSIPRNLTRLAALNTLDLSNNRLIGTIPDLPLGNGSRLEILYLQNNYLAGCIPTSLSNASRLQTLLLHHNQLTGPLTGVFNAAAQPRLSLIQVSQNQLTGSLPDDIFLLQKLETLVAVENCFSGSLPDCICDCTTLVTLALDGLQSASNCQNKIFFRISNSYITTRNLRNGIPKCLYELPNLYALHLSGNGFTGSLPDHANFSSTFRSLSLSNNILTGTIPHEFQLKSWEMLDLSFNHLEGELQRDFAHLPWNGSVSLETNRLSGKLPHAIIHAPDVSVLKGNLFDCSYDKRQLPSADQNKADYICGSTAFNVPYYVWLAAMSAILIAAFALWRRWDYFNRHFGLTAVANRLREYYDFPVKISETSRMSDVSEHSQSTLGTKSPAGRMHSVRFICDVMNIICYNSVQCAIFISVVLLLYFPISSPYFGTHKYLYAYMASAAFTSGVAPFVIESLLFAVFVTIVLVLFRRCLNYYQQHQSRRDRKDQMIVAPRENYFSMATLQKMPELCAYFGINFVIVIGVNVAFVYVTLHESSSILVLAQIFMSIFKILWNYFLSFFAVVFFAEKNLTGEEQQTNVSRVFFLQLFVMLMNNIAIPCLVVAAISPSCFYNVFVQAPSSTSSYVYEQCAGIILESGCNKYTSTEASVAYEPPYSYSYQCSSSIVKNYVPAFVYMCLAATFAVPAAQLFAMHRQAQQVPGSWRFKFLNRICQYPVLEAHNGENMPVEHDRYRMYFNANQVLLSQLTYLGMLMTFGVVFPPLAAAFAFTICVTSVFARLKVGYFLRHAHELRQWAYLDKINIECTRVVSLQMMHNAVWMLATFSCCFYALFLFDTLGDVVGFAGAFWVLIVLPVAPVVAYLVFRLSLDYTARHPPPMSDKSELDPDNLSGLDSVNGLEGSKGSSLSSPSDVVLNPLSLDTLHDTVGDDKL